MTALKLESFMGLVPRVSKRLLPPTAATTARNTKLLSGEARGFRVPRVVTDLTALSYTVRRAYRIPYVDEDTEELEDFWLTFDTRNVDIVRSPLVNDTHNRYYWCGEGIPPQYNTFERMLAGDDPYLLGIPYPNPASKPVVTPPAGDDESRVYLYTFYSEYGEESAPSAPSDIKTGDAGTWVISSMLTTIPDASQHPATMYKRIYRTVSGDTATLFYFVAQIPLADASYNDTSADDVVVLNPVLESQSYFPPPSDMEGFVVMPNGYLVGWIDRRLLFSEPYRPHAWPPEYELGTEFEMVGLAVWGNTLVVGTQSNPYVGMGTSPAAFTNQKTDAVMPCMSRRGLVATDAGVYYPSINGLVLVNSPTPQIITQDCLLKKNGCVAMIRVKFSRPATACSTSPLTVPLSDLFLIRLSPPRSWSSWIDSIISKASRQIATTARCICCTTTGCGSLIQKVRSVCSGVGSRKNFICRSR